MSLSYTYSWIIVNSSSVSSKFHPWFNLSKHYFICNGLQCWGRFSDDALCTLSVCVTRNIFLGINSSLSLSLVHVSYISLWRKCVDISVCKTFSKATFLSLSLSLCLENLSQIHIYINKYVPNKHSLVCDNFLSFSFRVIFLLPHPITHSLSLTFEEKKYVLHVLCVKNCKIF